jgi:hypothetical protein
MGRWSRHPMGSDGALDARDAFMSDFDDKENDLYYFERDKGEIKNALLNLSLDQLKKMADRTGNDKFVVPYTFIDYEAYPTDPKIKEFLLECLDYHDDLYEYGNGEEERHIQIFKDNFDDIISGRKFLEEDGGLFAAMEESLDEGNPGLINKTKDN